LGARIFGWVQRERLRRGDDRREREETQNWRHDASSSNVMQDGREGREGRFLFANLSIQSKHWPKGSVSVRMETLPVYALELSVLARGEDGVL
jgi:hypothetical protein